MAGKLITLEEAAQMLGVSASEVSEMRQRQEVYGYRDGGSWKFKQEDIEKIVADRAGSSGGSTTSSSGIDFDLPASASGVGLPFDMDDAKSDPLGLSGSGSGLTSGSNLGSGLNLMGESDLGLSPASDIHASAQKGPNSPPSTGSGLDLLGSDVQLAAMSGTGSNIFSGSGSGIGGDAGKTMLTAELADRPAGDSSVKLSMRESDSVLTDGGSDVTLDVAGSGINLTSPKDSGILLDNLDLASASGIGKRGGSDTSLKTDEDFLLTPMEEQGDDSTDSGSQVIALEGSDFADDATATLIAGEVPGLSSALDEGGLGSFGGPGGLSAGSVNYQPAGPDTVFGAGSVITLVVCTLFMGLAGVMMYDIVRNMWSWDTPYSFSSTLMDMILQK
jgi:excisionase family DNA binding protein